MSPRDIYQVPSFFCRKVRKNGGAGICVKQHINFKDIKFEQFSEEMHTELCCVKLVEQNRFVISLYRSPQDNIESFIPNFELALKSIIRGGALVTICGEFNIEVTVLKNTDLIDL